MDEKEQIQDAKKWIEERMTYILQNCDLKEKDNKRAYNSLNIALKCLEKEI